MMMSIRFKLIFHPNTTCLLSKFSIFVFTVFLTWARILLCSSNCEPNGTISTFLPGKHLNVMARKIEIEGITMAVVGDMVLGDVVCDVSKNNNSEHVELKGDFSWPGLTDFGASSKNNRHLEVLKITTRWPGSEVYYEIGSGFPTYLVTAIQCAAWLWTHSSPVRFIESSTAVDRIMITPVEDRTCFSYLGRRGGTQTMGISFEGACTMGNILHEFGHAIGWHHEHMRPDREDYITVVKDEILLGYEDAYRMMHPSQIKYGAHDYDYGSIMHYKLTGPDGRNVIKVVEDPFNQYRDRYPNELYNNMPGQRMRLSTLDKKMSYTYFQKCADISTYTDLAEGLAQWKAYPWGGCEVQCDGPSYRQRYVTCMYRDACVADFHCSASTMPSTRQLCELEPGNLVISFDESSLHEKGGIMQNVAFYDQFDWLLWKGEMPLTEQISDHLQYVGAVKGPGGDASESGDGNFLLFPSLPQKRNGDQAWYESPVVWTTNLEPCQVSFAFFSTSTKSKLRVELVSCEDCTETQQVWEHKGSTPSWSRANVTLPALLDDKIKLRFVGQHVTKGDGNIGIDSIEFSEGCIRPDLDELREILDAHAPLAYPYEDPDISCAYINNDHVGFYFLFPFFTALNLSICCGILFILMCCLMFGAIEFLLRKRKLKNLIYKTEDQTSNRKEVAQAYLTLRSITSFQAYGDAIQKDIQRMGSFITEPAVPLSRLASLSVMSKSENCHQNKMVSVAQSEKEDDAPYFGIPTVANGEKEDDLIFTLEQMKLGIHSKTAANPDLSLKTPKGQEDPNEKAYSHTVSASIQSHLSKVISPHVKHAAEFWRDTGCADRVQRMSSVLSFSSNNNTVKENANYKNPSPSPCDGRRSFSLSIYSDAYTYIDSQACTPSACAQPNADKRKKRRSFSSSICSDACKYIDSQGGTLSKLDTQSRLSFKEQLSNWLH